MGKKSKQARKKGNKKSGRSSVALTRSPAGPFAPMMRTTLHYAETHIDGTATPGFAVSTYGLNDVYAPAAGAQPRGFDQLALIYARFRVVKCTANVIATVSNNATPHYYVLSARHSTSAPTTIREAMERQGAVFDITTGAVPAKLTKTVDVQTLVGENYKSEQFAGQYNASPANIAVWHLAWRPCAESGTSAYAQFVIYLTYVVDFYQLRNVADA